MILREGMALAGHSECKFLCQRQLEHMQGLHYCINKIPAVFVHRADWCVLNVRPEMSSWLSSGALAAEFRWRQEHAGGRGGQVLHRRAPHPVAGLDPAAADVPGGLGGQAAAEPHQPGAQQGARSSLPLSFVFKMSHKYFSKQIKKNTIDCSCWGV